jgi:hypothetical protein
MATKTVASIDADPEKYASGPVAEASKRVECSLCGAPAGRSCVGGSPLLPVPTHAERAESFWRHMEDHR